VSPRFKVYLQYLFILAITLLLIWFSLRGIEAGEGEDKWDYLLRTWHSADKGWLLIMALIAMVSHVVRAQRWRMLLEPVGYNVRLDHSFYSLMVGYLINLVIPRGGEVSRCYNLYKLEKTPVDASFGTVVVERIADLICLAALIGISFLLESKKLIAFLNTLPIERSGSSSGLMWIIYILIVLTVMGVVFWWLFKRHEKLRTFVIKTWAGFRSGLLSVFRLKNKSLFVFYSLLIWFLYFLMSYAVIRAFPSTAGLGFNAVLSLFAIGAIAMAAPLPGGTGSFHVLVPQGLVFLYAVQRSDAVAFTFIFHGWQTLIMIVGGAFSLLITSILMKRKTTAS
jgi:uncharacterized protein (TIRG00374 family)